MKDSVIVSWLLLLYGYFKKSVLYRVFDRCYRAVSNSWKNSAIIGYFRKYREDGELFRQSATYKVVCFPLWLIDKIKVPVRKSVKNSAIIRQASVCLDNVLALNTRFLGFMAASFGVVFALGVVLARHTAPAAWVWVFIAASALLSLLDVNVMSQGAKSLVLRFVGFCLGEDICYDFFDEEKTTAPSPFVGGAFGGGRRRGFGFGFAPFGRFSCYRRFWFLPIE